MHFKSNLNPLHVVNAGMCVSISFPLLPSLIYAKQKRHVPYRLYPMFKPWDKVKANVSRNTSILYMKYVVWNCQ